MRYAFILILLAGCSSATGNACTNAVGDVDGDGKIEPYDASLTLSIAEGIRAGTECEYQAADFDGDGVVTEADAQLIFDHWLNG